jgi:hypothetical protein
MRRTLIGIAVLVGALAVAVTIWLFATASGAGWTVALPLPAADRELMAQVPADASEFALIAAAGPTHRQLERNPVTADLIHAWAEGAGARFPLLLGRADVVAWRANGRVGMAASVDAVRAVLLRAWILVSGSEEVSIERRTLFRNRSDHPMAAGDLEPLIELAAGLPRASALVWQTSESRGAFPPVGRPSASAVSLTGEGVRIQCASAERTGDAAAQRPLGRRFPTNAAASIEFAASPPFAGEIERLVGVRVRPLLEDGGMLVIYDVDSRTLVPRPIGLLVLPGDSGHRAALASLLGSIESIGKDLVAETRRQVGPTQVVRRRAFGGTMETAESAGELLISFDGASLERYLGGGFEPVEPKPAVWIARIDPSRLAPLVAAGEKNRALRLLTPKIARSARDVNRWIGYLSGVHLATARKMAGSRGDELQVVVTTK